MQTPLPRPLIALALAATSLTASCASTRPAAAAVAPAAPMHGLQVKYLEIVTPGVDDTVALLEEIHGVTFGEPVEVFGGARQADLAGGGTIGVRAPMHDMETPVVRPYFAADDVVAAIEAAGDAGCEIAHPALQVPGIGTFGIYFQGSNQYGAWKD